MGAGELALVGGHVAIDFVNTLGGTLERPIECLHDYGDLLAWARHADLIDNALADRLSRQKPKAAFDRTLALRAHLDTVLRAGLAQHDASADLAALVATYRNAVSHARLAPDNGYAWTWPAEQATPDEVSWRLAVHAVDLLQHTPLEQLRQCAGCRYLFLDHSKNNSRRWCRMRGCGDNAKMRRYRARKGANTDNRGRPTSKEGRPPG